LISRVKNRINKSEFFIPLFFIAPFDLKMNVNLDYALLNIDLFKDATLMFRSFRARGIDDLDELKKAILRFYLKSVKKQLGSFVKDLPLLRNIKNLSTAAFGMFYSPYMQYKEGGNVLGGIKHGVFEFAGSVANESLNFVDFVMGTLDNVAGVTGIKSKLIGEQ